MAEAAAAAPEGVLHRRIEFHPARRLHAAAATGVRGGFRMETLNPDAGRAVAPAAAAAGGEGEGRREAKGEVGAGGGGLDPELSVARIYLGRIGAGLQNLGNTCYLNSVLQCLTYTEPFAAYLQSGKHKSSCRTAGFCALCALQSHVRSALQSTGKILTPSQFVKNLRCISRSFRNSRQEDAHELMVNLLESMHKCCLPSGVPSESPSAYEKSLVHKIFGGRLRSQVRCTRCSFCSNKFDPFLDLSLEIAKATTLLRALHNFTEEELLDGGEKQYQCQRCRQKVVAKKRFTIDKAPYVLTIHLKRFSPFNPREKIDKKVDFDPILDLKPFVSDSEGTDLKYSLYGVLVHAGWSTQSGHYYCFVRTSSGMWHNLDDNQVRQVREADVLRQKAYMLFYVRDRVRSPVMRKDNSTANLSGKVMAPQKISCLNGVIPNGMIETKLNGSSFTYGDMRFQKAALAQSSFVSNTSADKFSKNVSNTGAVESAASENGVPASVQKASPVHPDDGAILSIKSKQIASDSHKETPCSGQPDVILGDASGNQKLPEMSMQELQTKANGALTHSGKDASAAPPISNGPDRLLEADEWVSQTQTHHFSRPTSNVNDTAIAAETIPIKDATVSNGVILTSSDETKDFAGSLKQYVGGVTVKEPSTEGTNDVANTENKNTATPKVEEVKFEKQIFSEDSIQEEVATGSKPRRMNLKSKKFMRYPVMNLYFGPKHLLLASLKQRKKKKYKRTKRQPIPCKDKANIACLDDNTDEQQASTSATVISETVECKSYGRKRTHGGKSAENVIQTFNSGQHPAGAGAVHHSSGMKGNENATLASAELPKSCPGSAANQIDSRTNADANQRVSRHVSLLTRGLTEVTVPQWDDIDVPNTKTLELKHSRSRSIGYVLDEWDEVYDCGRRKKVRRSKEDFGGPNPFQETADIRSRRRMKLKADQGRSGNQPLRLEDLRV